MKKGVREEEVNGQRLQTQQDSDMLSLSINKSIYSKNSKKDKGRGAYQLETIDNSGVSS